MQKIFVIVLTIIFLCPTSLFAKINPIELSPPNFPIDEMDNNDPQKLITDIKKRIAVEPQNYENYSILAFAYDYIGDYENELEALKLEVQYLPDDLEDKDVIFGNLARAYMLNEQWEEGKKWLDKADKINPRNFYNCWNAFDYYLFHKKDFKTAAFQLKRLQEFYGEDEDQYYEAYTKAFENSVDPTEIIELFKASVKLEPKNNKTHRALGVAIRNSSKDDYEKNIPSSMKELSKALKLNPKYIPTYISIANTYMLLGARTDKDEDYQVALDWFNKANEINPNDSRLAYAMGTFFYYGQEYDKAIEKLESAYAKGVDGDHLKENLAWAYNNKAYSLYQSGTNLHKGMKMIDKAIELLPGNGIILGTKAELLYKIGNFSEAYQYIKMALELEPDKEEMKQDLKRIEEALESKGALNL